MLVQFFFLFMLLTSNLSLLRGSGTFVNVSLVVDFNSIKDFMVTAKSVLAAASSPSRVALYVVACEKDMNRAEQLKKTILELCQSCIPELSTLNIVPFVIPATSGFFQQLHHPKRKGYHWSTQSGADMVRFFIPSIFPDIKRILYLDNDVVVSCCLEYVWTSKFPNNSVVGLVLDDLRWAAYQQFTRFYNATHPVVIENLRRQELINASLLNRTRLLQTPIDVEDFVDTLSKYPNDGVLLFNVDLYNKLKILDILENIAQANTIKDYVVGVGTQQFTVLAMYDRWFALPAQANLRHSPDVSRNLMVHHLYNGFIHFAGYAKPMTLCKYGRNANQNRLYTFTPWATTIARLSLKCPSEKRLSELLECSRHVPLPTTIPKFLSLLKDYISSQNADFNQYIRVGKSVGSLKLVDQRTFESWSDVNDFIQTHDTLYYIDNLILHKSNYSTNMFDNQPMKVYLADREDKGVKILRHLLQARLNHIINISSSMLDMDNRERKTNRMWLWHQAKFCPYESGQSSSSAYPAKQIGEQISHKYHYQHNKLRKHRQHVHKQLQSSILSSQIAGGKMSLSSTSNTTGSLQSIQHHQFTEGMTATTHCLPFLGLLDVVRLKHWSIQIVVLDTTNDADNASDDIIDVIHSLSLDTIRPRFVFLKLNLSHYDNIGNNSQSGSSYFFEDRKDEHIISMAKHYLSMHGFMTYHDCSNYCSGDSDALVNDVITSKHNIHFDGKSMLSNEKHGKFAKLLSNLKARGFSEEDILSSLSGLDEDNPDSHDTDIMESFLLSSGFTKIFDHAVRGNTSERRILSSNSLNKNFKSLITQLQLRGYSLEDIESSLSGLDVNNPESHDVDIVESFLISRGLQHQQNVPSNNNINYAKKPFPTQDQLLQNRVACVWGTRLTSLEYI